MAEEYPVGKDDERIVKFPASVDFSLLAAFSAEVEREGERELLLSTQAGVEGRMLLESESTPFGESEIHKMILPFAKQGCELLLRRGTIPGIRGMTLRCGVRNVGAQTMRLVRTTPVAMPSAGTAAGRVNLQLGMLSGISHPLGKPEDDRSVNHTPMRIRGEEFARGIGCHAPCELRFPLDGRFVRFRSVVGVDDSGSGSVTFEVHADGRKIYDSGRVLRGQAGRSVDLDLSGARELRLVVTDARDGPSSDWADWAMAELTPVTDLDSVLPPPEGFGPRASGAWGDWLVSPMTSQVGSAAPHLVDRLFGTLEIRESAGVYDRQGNGLFFGPVGEPVAYVDARIVNAGNRRVELDIGCAMDSVEVLPGETRWGQQVVLLAETPQTAQDRWISWVAASHRARPARDSLSGWLSWYWMSGNVSEAGLTKLTDFVKHSGGTLRPSVIQIDDFYQRSDGQPGFNEKFPSGMRGVAEQISATGAMPGLMLRMLNDSPESAGPFLDSVRHAVGQGYRYLKISQFETTPDPHHRQTRFEKRRALYQSIRQSAGEQVYLLIADHGVDRACVGFMDAGRSLTSAGRHELAAGIDDTLRTMACNHRWFTVDNDCHYLATDLEELAPIAGGWPMVRTWLSVTGLVGGNAMTSDPWHWDRMKPFLRHTEILTPPANEKARAIDLGRAPGLARVVGTVRRPWGEWTVALLRNPGLQSEPVTLDFAEAGMDSNRRYAVWSFWENRFLGIAKTSWTSPALEPNASQHLCFTPVDDNLSKPLLIGSNLHVWCGAAELGQVISLHGAMEFHLTDAGARDGDLFVRCGSEPQIRSVSGCRVLSVTDAGENIWKIAVSGRQSGAMQRIELGLRVPVTSQPWFWTLLVLLVSSLAFGLWRYVEKRRIEQQVLLLRQKSALDEERARIARDLHDELGASLARIGLLTEMADPSTGDTDHTRKQLGNILLASKTLARQLDAIVWSVDPANDTLESLARYLHGHAEDYLGIAGIRCRFEAEELPDLPLHSALRHHLLMITKEALHNIVKHSQASRATIHVALNELNLTLSVVDDGCGCEPPSDGRRRGNGLNNMAKRAHAVGGVLEIRPGPDGRGTEVMLTLPISFSPPHSAKTPS